MGLNCINSDHCNSFFFFVFFVFVFFVFYVRFQQCPLALLLDDH